jgi:hypothetical protein
LVSAIRTSRFGPPTSETRLMVSMAVLMATCRPSGAFAHERRMPLSAQSWEAPASSLRGFDPLSSASQKL